jgi:hypothetical protein
MRRNYPLSGKCLLLFLLVAAGYSSAKCPLPSRQIDRPLQDTMGVGQVSIGVAIEKRFQSDSLAGRLSFPGISYSVTNRIELTSIPWPVIQFLILKPDSIARPGSFQSLALAFRVGATSSIPPTQISPKLSGLDQDYIRVFPRMTFLGKLPLTKALWVDWELTTGTISDEATQGLFIPHLGIQLTKRIYALVGYRGEVIDFWVPDRMPVDVQSYLYRFSSTVDFYRSSWKYGNGTYVAHSMPISIGCNLGRVSLELSTSINKSVEVAIPVSFITRFYW